MFLDQLEHLRSSPLARSALVKILHIDSIQQAQLRVLLNMYDNKTSININKTRD